jgi:hypothetical protein
MKQFLLFFTLLYSLNITAQNWELIQTIPSTRNVLLVDNVNTGTICNSGKNMVYKSFSGGTEEIISDNVTASAMNAVTVNGEIMVDYVDDKTYKPGVIVKVNGKWTTIQKGMSKSLVYNVHLIENNGIAYLAYTDTKQGYKQMLVF